MKITLPKLTNAELDAVINRLFTNMMSPEAIAKRAKDVSFRPTTASKLERSPVEEALERGKLCYKMPNGKDVPVDTPSAPEALVQSRREQTTQRFLKKDKP